MTHNIERRVREAEQGSTPAPARTAVPSVAVRSEPPARKATASKAAEPKHPALTDRERRVKKILLKELKRVSEWKRLSYAEKQHLDKTINVAFIDRELVKMQKQLRWLQRLLIPIALVATVMLSYTAWLIVTSDGPIDFWDVLYWPLLTLTYVVGPLIQRRALLRKQFIYEALRELSDADEDDLTLGEVLGEADRLIAEIIDRENETDARYPLHLLRQRA